MRQVTGYIPSWDPSIFSKLDTMLCTTFIISFASVDPNGRVTPPENIKELSGVLKTGSSKVTLSVGGGNAGPAIFKTVAADPNLREVFAKSCLEICKQYNLDGIDIDWEFPDSSDRENFVALHRVLKQALGGRTVTSALAASNWFVNNQKIYDIGALSRHVDAIHLLTYDFHMDANWDVQSGVNFNAPLSADGGDSLENGIKMFLDGGMPAAKILVGVPFFSRVYKLQDPSKHDPGAPFVVGNQASDPSNYVLSYAKIAPRLNDSSWTKKWNDKAQSPYMYKGDLWTSYEDTRSISEKSKLANQYGLGGVMIWAINQDDFNGVSGQTQTLLRAVNRAVREDLPSKL